jgi:hypothetical protein
MIVTRMIMAAAAALAVVGVAAAGSTGIGANSASFNDPAGDAGAAPDVTTVNVANNDAGAITFRIGIANRAVFGPDDYVGVVIDADGKENAEGYLTPEYVLEYSGEGAQFLMWDGDSWQGVPPFLLHRFSGSYAGGVLTFTVNQTDLANTQTAWFFVRGGTGDEATDDAPDGDVVWEYDVVSPSLAVLAFAPPKTAAVGQRLVAGMTVRGATPDTARVVCTARIGTQRIAGRGDWFRIIAGAFEKATPRCTWTPPRGTHGKLLRGTMTVSQSGLQVTRSFSVRIGGRVAR